MTRKIIAFGASNSKKSINKKLATYTANLFTNSEVEIIDLNNFEAPLYSIDKEKENGFPAVIEKFITKINAADLLVLSMAEHNANYTVAFKNILDWASRINVTFFNNQKVFLLSTSPGARGGKSVLEITKDRLPKHGATILATFSLPSFNENFDYEKGVITNEKLDKELKELVTNIEF